MRWPVFLIAAFLFLALDSGFMGLLTLHRMGGIAPHIVFALVVFICLFANKLSALWACLVLGVLMDITLPPRGAGGLAFGAGQTVNLIGPHALGALLAGYCIVQMRTMVFRQRALTIGVLTTAATFIAGLVAIALYIIRSWYGEPITYPTEGSAFAEIFRHMGIALYSGLVAIPVGWILLRTLPVWGFQSTLSRRSTNFR